MTVSDGQVHVSFPGESSDLVIDDPDGWVGALLGRLDGTRTEAQLVASLCDRFPRLTEASVRGALADLDGASLLDHGDSATGLSAAERDRYRSNLAFFGRYESSANTRFSIQERLQNRHVVLLGAGGTGGAVLPQLVGLGIGRIDIVDDDVVELGNLSRQVIFAEADLGKPKVEVAARVASALNSNVAVSAHQLRIIDGAQIDALLSGVDLLVCAIDTPPSIRHAVNEACVRASVPFISGGFGAATASYYSVEPGVSGCTRCLGPYRPLPEIEEERVNPGIGPTAGLLASLITLEALRYLTRFAEPIAASTVWVADLRTGTLSVGQTWTRSPDCPVCSVIAGASG